MFTKVYFVGELSPKLTGSSWGYEHESDNLSAFIVEGDQSMPL